MDAYISSSRNARELLQGLEDTAKDMGIYVNGTSRKASTDGKRLRLFRSIEGQPTVVIISRHKKRMLAASLDNQETLADITAKKRLAALLIPLVSDYVRSQGDLGANGRVRIMFGDTVARGRSDKKKCVLFAEDSGSYSQILAGLVMTVVMPAHRSGKSLSPTAAERSPAASWNS